MAQIKNYHLTFDLVCSGRLETFIWYMLCVLGGGGVSQSYIQLRHNQYVQAENATTKLVCLRMTADTVPVEITRLCKIYVYVLNVNHTSKNTVLV